MQFCMALYVQIVKRHAKEPTISDVEFVSLLFEPYVNAGHIKAKNGEPLDLNKTRVSQLLAQKDDVPGAMRAALSLFGIREKTNANFSSFVEDYLDQNQLSLLVSELLAAINSANNIGFEIKAAINASIDDISTFLTDAFIEAVRVSNKRITEINLWHCGSNSLNLISGDLLDYGFKCRRKTPNIIVIPVNTAFDTHVTWKLENAADPVVSPRTIHGQWLIRWGQSGENIEALSDLIMKDLLCRNVSMVKRPDGSFDFDIGTISAIYSDKAIYYLLAISRFDEHNIAHSTSEEIKTALVSLLVFYNHYGLGYPLYLPLMGTGNSRAALQYTDSMKLICDTFLQHKEMIQGTINIVAKNDAFNEIEKGE